MQHKINQQRLQQQVSVDSAGTHAYHVGEQSDPRSRAFAAGQGIDMDFIRARKISVNDYDSFDYILAMDEDNLALIEYYAPDQHDAQIALFLQAAHELGVVSELAVPDPYYGGDSGFAHVFDLVNHGCDAWLAKLANV